MSQAEPVDINRLVAIFTDLQERWESDRQGFDWSALEALAREGAHAYNEGAGPAFHALVLDGVTHTEIHERFLHHSLEAGFDPFHVSRAGESQNAVRPLLDHAGLVRAAAGNEFSARMHSRLSELARSRFAPMVEQAERGDAGMAATLYAIFSACAESIPKELVERIAPQLARTDRPSRARDRAYPEEGYLAAAEVILDNTRPHG